MIRVLVSCSRISNGSTRKLHNSSRLFDFWEPKRSNYPVIHDIVKKEEKLSLLGRLKAGCRDIKGELSLFLTEMRDLFRIHHTEILPDAKEILWKFDGTEDCRNKWILSCDSDYNQGFSTAKLDFTLTGTGLFHGELNPRLPKDGTIGRAGYCNITTATKRKSFKRATTYDIDAYNCLVLRVRGDGRCYMLNMLQRGYVDITWYHSYHYFLYTTGGPYWQDVKIPFAKFVYSAKGGVQDDQTPLPPNMITHFGITLSDTNHGPFKLEIDYIGVCYDASVFEKCAYEMNDMSQS
ncbi:complex I intermediate-associated protein 30 [Halictus rubicundus]|uniref:complex I intermediate-associated protein 30 n=1 Tax=Halictus rubicundus TaxID=77578 RepID=UPI004036C48F